MSGANIIIKEAKKGHMRGILHIIKEYQKYDVEFARRYYEKYFSKRNDEMTEKDKVYIALFGEELAGVIGYWRDYLSTDYSYWLGWFVVKEKFRKKHIGTKLLKKVEAELKAKKKKKLFVSTEDYNAVAKHFYTKNGFRTEGVIRDYYGDKEDQLIMSKKL